MSAKLDGAGASLQLLQSAECAGSSIDVVVHELADREQRRKNLIVFNMPESVQGTNESKKRVDEQSVRSLISNLVPEDLSQARINVVRIGNRGDNKIRPLKVVLPSETIVANILRNSKKLHDLPQYDRVAVSSDRTPMQRQQYNLLKRELDQRVASGERDLRIRFTNGIPKITKGN